MQRLQALMSAPQTRAPLVPDEQNGFPHYYRSHSPLTRSQGASLRVESENPPKRRHSSSPFEGRGSCYETHPADTHVPFAEQIVHFIGNDSAKTKALSEFLISKQIRVVTFTTATEYIASTRDDRPTCLVLDLVLPDVNGLELQRNLSGSGAPPIIFVTAESDPVSAVRAMKNGAVDVLVDPIDYQQLMTALELAFIADLKMRNERIELTSLLTRWRSLTPRETEVFHYTVAGLLNKQGAAELGVAQNTYQVHRGRVMRKMNASSLADLVRMSTKLEPILPQPCQRRTCYGATVVVPSRIAECELNSQRNMSFADRALPR